VGLALGAAEEAGAAEVAAGAAEVAAGGALVVLAGAAEVAGVSTGEGAGVDD